jgi:hypothetical protein
MTARHIQRRIMWEQYRRNFVLPNYTPLHWWECDVFSVTKSGFFHEFEIKLSASDFRADAGKERRDFDWNKRVNKHQLLSANDTRGPCVFWFVMPLDLVPLEQVPTWAGVIWAIPTGKTYKLGSHLNPALRLGRRAPRLHKTKLDPRILARARESCYWRYHSALNYPDYREPEYSI